MKKTNKPEDQAASNARRRARRLTGATITRRPIENLSRRRRLEKEPAKWLRWYCVHAFPLAWGQVHLDIISAAVRAVKTGAGMAVAAPRGTGKSTVLWGVALWALLSGAARFPVVCGWSHGAARRALRKWLQALAENDRIRADYPEFTQPFEVSQHSNRLKGMTWADTDQLTGADVRIMDGVLILPDAGGALGAVSMGGNVRGLFAGLPDGSTIRPDVLLLDDPQDRSTALNPALVRKVAERIESDLFNVAGPDIRLAVMAAVTVIAEGDVAEYFLKHPDFEALRVAQVTAWPSGFDDKGSASRKLWEAWNIERIEGLADHDGGKRAIAFYKVNKAAMIEGAAVSWPMRYDKKRGDPDAIYAAFYDYYRLGEVAFMSERQNTPMKETTTAYILTPVHIAAHVQPGRTRCDIPQEARIFTAATDLNHYGLHTCTVGFGNDQTGLIPWYGRYDNDGQGIVPKNCPESEGKRRMFEALVLHGKELAALPFSRGGEAARIGVWFIDGGYMPDVVRRYVEGPGRTLGMLVTSARGYSADHYRPTPRNVIGAARELCHLTESPIAGRFIAFCACYWREISQRAWLGTVGAPGGLSLYDGGRHSEFAEQICRERLLEKLAGQYGMVWRWATQPGWHDYADALTMCYVAAAWNGIGTTSGAGMTAKARPPRYIERRKAKTPRE